MHHQTVTKQNQASEIYVQLVENNVDINDLKDTPIILITETESNVYSQYLSKKEAEKVYFQIQTALQELDRKELESREFPQI